MTQKKYYKGTAKGVALFPSVVTPDTQFDKQGMYSTKLRVPAEAAEKIRETLEGMLKATVENAIADLETRLADAKPVEAKKIRARIVAIKSGELVNDLPIAEDEDRETGEVNPDVLVLNFRRKAYFTDRNGNQRDFTLPLYDAKGNALSSSQREALSVWSGSTLEVAFTYLPYVTPKGIGVRMGMDAVRLINVKSGGASADDYGFGTDEDGFSADDINTNSSAPTGEADGTEESFDSSGDDFC